MDQRAIRTWTLPPTAVLLSYREVAELLGVSVRTLQRFVAAGLLRVVPFTSRTKRVRASELERFIEHMSEQTDDGPVVEPNGQIRFRL